MKIEKYIFLILILGTIITFRNLSTASDMHKPRVGDGLVWQAPDGHCMLETLTNEDAKSLVSADCP